MDCSQCKLQLNLHVCVNTKSIWFNDLMIIQSSFINWGRVTHICVGNLIIICSDNGLSPGRRQAIIWTNAGILLIGTIGTNFSEISIEILTFSFKKIRLKVSSVKWRPFCLSLNMLKSGWTSTLMCLLSYYIELQAWISRLIACLPAWDT